MIESRDVNWSHLIASGEQLGRVEAPENSSYGMMTYIHEGRQYLILQTASKLTAMALYED